MPKDPQEFADLFGAKLAGEVPDAGAGPFGMARLAHLKHQRLTPGQGDRPGRPTDSIWESRPKVPMSQATRQRLAVIAEAMSTPQRQVSPMQVAAQLLEEAVSRVPLQGEVCAEGIAPDPGESIPPRPTEDAPEESPASAEATKNRAAVKTPTPRGSRRLGEPAGIRDKEGQAVEDQARSGTGNAPPPTGQVVIALPLNEGQDKVPRTFLPSRPPPSSIRLEGRAGNRPRGPRTPCLCSIGLPGPVAPGRQHLRQR